MEVNYYIYIKYRIFFLKLFVHLKCVGYYKIKIFLETRSKNSPNILYDNKYYLS